MVIARYTADGLARLLIAHTLTLSPSLILPLPLSLSLTAPFILYDFDV